MPWFENNCGDSFWYEDVGKGKVLILLHGWCMSSAIWRFQLDALFDSFRIIAPDLRGHGKSIKSFSCLDFDKLSHDIELLIDELNVSDVVLAGWSLGAQLVLQTFPLVRDKLSAIVLISGTPRFSSSDDFPYALSKNEADGMLLKVQRNIGRAINGFTRRMFTFDELNDPAIYPMISEILASIVLPTTEIPAQGINALIEADMRGLLSTVDIPALIINGDSDIICLPEASAYMSDKIKNSRHIVFEGCGHAPFLTQSQKFNDCLSDFIRSYCARIV